MLNEKAERTYKSTDLANVCGVSHDELVEDLPEILTNLERRKNFNYAVSLEYIKSTLDFYKVTQPIISIEYYKIFVVCRDDGFTDDGEETKEMLGVFEDMLQILISDHKDKNPDELEQSEYDFHANLIERGYLPFEMGVQLLMMCRDGLLHLITKQIEVETGVDIFEEIMDKSIEKHKPYEGVDRSTAH